MKKLYPIAIRFILGGAAIVLIALVLCGFDLRQLNTTPPYHEKTLGITDDVQRIEIYDTDALVMVQQGELQGDVRLEITCMESSQEDYLIIEEGGLLTVQYCDNRRVNRFNVNFGTEQRVLTLILPEDPEQEVQIATDSGDIFLQELELAGNVTLQTVSGNIYAMNIDFDGDVDVKTASGHAEFCDVRAGGDVRAELDSGRIYVYNTRVAGAAAVELDSGFFHADNLRADSLQLRGRSGGAVLYNPRIAGDVQAKTSSGSIDLVSPVIGGKTEIDTNSGYVEFSMADFAGLNVVTMSGDVSGSLLENGAAYAIETSSASGSVHVPTVKPTGTEELRSVTVTTSSGDIEITLDSAVGG